MWVCENECNLSSARSGSESVLKRIFCGIEGLERKSKKGSQKKGTFYFTGGFVGVRLLECHKHPELLAVVLFTMS